MGIHEKRIKVVGVFFRPVWDLERYIYIYIQPPKREVSIFFWGFKCTDFWWWYTFGCKDLGFLRRKVKMYHEFRCFLCVSKLWMLFLPFLEYVYDGISSTHLSLVHLWSASFNPLAGLFHPKLVSTGVATSPGPLKSHQNTHLTNAATMFGKKNPIAASGKSRRFLKDKIQLWTSTNLYVTEPLRYKLVIFENKW